MHCSVNLGETMKKNFIFEISNFKLIRCKVLWKAKKIEFGTKYNLVGYF